MKPECKKYYRDDGSIKLKKWYLNDKYHRTDGPAYIYYGKDGNVEIERWYLNDKCHRIDGPAYICYREDGNIEIECWHLNGEYHRADGPAFIRYRNDGSVEREGWYLNDEYIDPEEHLTPTPKTEEEKIELINKFVFIEEGNDYVFIKEWLKRDKKFYDKYRILVE